MTWVLHKGVAINLRDAVALFIGFERSRGDETQVPVVMAEWYVGAVHVQWENEREGYTEHQNETVTDERPVFTPDRSKGYDQQLADCEAWIIQSAERENGYPGRQSADRARRVT